MSDQNRPPKRTEKLQLMLDLEELKAIDDWRFENRLPSRAAAIRELIRRGLISNEFEEPPTDAPSGEVSCCGRVKRLFAEHPSEVPVRFAVSRARFFWIPHNARSSFKETVSASGSSGCFAANGIKSWFKPTCLSLHFAPIRKSRDIAAVHLAQGNNRSQSTEGTKIYCAK